MAATNYAIKQGDAYAIPVSLRLDDEVVTEDSLDLIETVEFMISEEIRKVYPDDVSFDAENNVFLVPVTQEETFALEEGETIKVDLRVEFIDGDVIGTKTMEKIKVVDALSEVTL